MEITVEAEKGKIMKLYSEIMLLVVLLGFSGAALAAYPPDNAAVLYHRAFMLTEQPSDELDEMLNELRRGNIGLNDQIRQYVERNRTAIKYAMDAAQVENCDWGWDISEGFALDMPELAKLRQLACLLIADAKMLTEKGDYETALERCLGVHLLGRNCGDMTLILYLLGAAFNEAANKSIVDILPNMQAEPDTLMWLKSELVDISSRPASLKAPIAMETEVVVKEMMSKETVVSTIEGLGEEFLSSLSAGTLDRLREADEDYFIRARQEYKRYMSAILSALDQPYPRGHEEIQRLAAQLKEDSAEKPELAFVAFMAPMVSKGRSCQAAKDTFFNAVTAAIDIYLVKARTGKLPEKLPEGLPKDMFSGKDFVYEQTPDGFILRCQGKDLDKDEIHQYEFKVKN